MPNAAQSNPDGAETEVMQVLTKQPDAAPHDPVLTVVEFALLNSLVHVTGSIDRAMIAQAETVLDADTIAAFKKYAATFDVMGVPVGEAVANIDDAQHLMSLKKRLDLASAVVQRQLSVKLAPIAAAASSVHSVLASLPEGSPMLDAFDTHMDRWQKLYGKGGRPAKVVAPPVDPANPR